MKRLNPSPVYEPLLNTNGQLEAFSSCWCLNEGLSHRSLFFGSVMLHNERSRIINSQLCISVVLLLTTYQMSELFKSHFAVSFFAYRGLILMKLHAVEFNQNTNLRNRETCKHVERRFITSFSGCSNPEASVSVIVAGRVFVIKWWVSFGRFFVWFILLPYCIIINWIQIVPLF